MTEIILPPRDPAELARVCAGDLLTSGYLDDLATDGYENDTIVRLEELAAKVGFLDQEYAITSYIALSLPKSFKGDRPQVVTHHQEPDFSGILRTYGTLKIGEKVGRKIRTKAGRGAIRALCMMFDCVIIQPDEDHLADDHLLYVPVYAVKNIAPSQQEEWDINELL